MRHKGYQADAYPIGFVVHPVHSLLGASPDRLLRLKSEDSNDYIWYLMEVKNWYVTAKQKTIEDLPYLKKAKSGQLELKRHHSHFYQIQTALMVTGFKECFFVVYGGSESMSLSQKIEFDPEVSSEIWAKAHLFYLEHFLPMLEAGKQQSGR